MCIVLLLLIVAISVALWRMIVKGPLYDGDIKDRVVLITGASSGLGRSCSFAFHKKGCRIIMMSRDMKKLDQVKQDMIECCPHLPEPHIFQLNLLDNDITIQSSIAEAVQSFGGQVDILINNAGVGFRGSFLETTLQTFSKVMNTNFMGHVVVTKTIVPHMMAMQSKQCHIVGVCSVQGKIALPHRAPYAAAKHACQGFYDSLRAELAQRNIHVTVVNPGYIKTNHSFNALEGSGSRHAVLDDTTASGVEADYVAGKIVEAVLLRKKEVTLAPLLHRVVIWLRIISPSLYFWIMEKRAKKESFSLNQKQQ